MASKKRGGEVNGCREEGKKKKEVKKQKQKKGYTPFLSCLAKSHDLFRDTWAVKRKKKEKKRGVSSKTPPPPSSQKKNKKKK